MANSEGSTDIGVSEVVTQKSDDIDSISKALTLKLKSKDEKLATETVDGVDNTLEHLRPKYESFDSLIVIFNEIFHGTGSFYVNILKILRLISFSILFILFLNLEASLIFNIIDILYKFPQESVFSKLASISKSNSIYYWIALFVFLSLILVYTTKSLIDKNFKKVVKEENSYIGKSENEELKRKSVISISESKNFWIHSIFLNKELDSVIVRFEDNYDSTYKVNRETITIPKIFKFVVPIMITAAIGYLAKSDLVIGSQEIILLSLLVFLVVVSIIFIGFFLNFYREFMEEFIEILTPKNRATELRYKRIMFALRKANLIKVYKK